MQTNRQFTAVGGLLRLVAILGLGATLAACGGGGGGGGGGSGGGSTVGTLSVKVTDQRNTVVSGASVSVTVGTAAAKTGTTGADGTVAITGLTPGSASVSVTKDLYISNTGTATVTAGQTASVTVQITRRVGSIAGTITDQFNTPVPNATIATTVEGQTITGTTGADGKATLANVPTGAVAVSVTAAGYKNPPNQNLNVTENATTTFSLQLERQTLAAGGFVTSSVVGTPSADGKSVSFKLTVLVVDQDAQAITTLTANDFAIQPCTIDTTNTKADCVKSGNLADDTNYTAATATPNPFALIPGQPANPYAAALLLDQSRSILVSDPTDARIFASKVFMEKVGANDRVVLSAFASPLPGLNGTPLIPTVPLSIYGSFTADGTTYYDELDQLATQEGGGTPLYSSIDSMVNYTATNAPGGIPNQRKAVVVFTDGKDEVCATPATCQANTIANAVNKGVDLFTIGLSDQIDFETMAALAAGANGVFLFAQNAEQLVPIYGSLGNLLSRSLATYEVTFTIQTDTAGTFVNGRSILGHIQVNTTSNPVVLPFIVPIF